MNPRLMSGLPQDSANGLADQGERLIQQPDTVLYVIGRLTVGELRNNLKKKQLTPYLAVDAIDVLDAEDSEWAANLLSSQAEARRLAGQLELTAEPTDFAIVLKEFEEMANENEGVEDAKAHFAGWHDREHDGMKAPEGTDAQTVREYLAFRRQESDAIPPMPGRPDVEQVTFTSETPEPVGADA